MFVHSMSLSFALAAVGVLVTAVGGTHLQWRTKMPAVEVAITRIQIELADERVKELNDLMVRCGLTTKKDLFNNAMSIFEWAIEEAEAGKVIAAVNRAEQRYEVLRMPVLDAAAKRAPRTGLGEAAATAAPRRPAHVKMAT